MTKTSMLISIGIILKYIDHAMTCLTSLKGNSKKMFHRQKSSSSHTLKIPNKHKSDFSMHKMKICKNKTILLTFLYISLNSALLYYVSRICNDYRNFSFST